MKHRKMLLVPRRLVFVKEANMALLCFFSRIACNVCYRNAVISSRSLLSSPVLGQTTSPSRPAGMQVRSRSTCAFDNEDQHVHCIKIGFATVFASQFFFDLLVHL